MTAVAALLEVAVPDIGDFADVPVIEVLVAPGDTVAAEDPLVTLESDKATMDVPAPAAGVVKALHVKVGDKVSEGTHILDLETAAPTDAAGAPEPEPAERRQRQRRRQRQQRPRRAPQLPQLTGRTATTAVSTPARRCGAWRASWESTCTA